ncbi:hypothetical protein ScPMuIL_001016 [Solemya velum]
MFPYNNSQAPHYPQDNNQDQQHSSMNQGWRLQHPEQTGAANTQPQLPYGVSHGAVNSGQRFTARQPGLDYAIRNPGQVALAQMIRNRGYNVNAQQNLAQNSQFQQQLSQNVNVSGLFNNQTLSVNQPTSHLTTTNVGTSSPIMPPSPTVNYGVFLLRPTTAPSVSVPSSALISPHQNNQQQQSVASTNWHQTAVTNRLELNPPLVTTVSSSQPLYSHMNQSLPVVSQAVNQPVTYSGSSGEVPVTTTALPPANNYCMPSVTNTVSNPGTGSYPDHQNIPDSQSGRIPVNQFERPTSGTPAQQSGHSYSGSNDGVKASMENVQSLSGDTRVAPGISGEVSSKKKQRKIMKSEHHHLDPFRKTPNRIFESLQKTNDNSSGQTENVDNQESTPDKSTSNTEEPQTKVPSPVVPAEQTSIKKEKTDSTNDCDDIESDTKELFGQLNSPTRSCGDLFNPKLALSEKLLDTSIFDQQMDILIQVQLLKIVTAIGANYVLQTEEETISLDLMCYWCNFCEFKTRQKDALKLHVRKEHRFKCQDCEFEAFTRAEGKSLPEISAQTSEALKSPEIKTNVKKKGQVIAVNKSVPQRRSAKDIDAETTNKKISAYLNQLMPIVQLQRLPNVSPVKQKSDSEKIAENEAIINACPPSLPALESIKPSQLEASTKKDSSSPAAVEKASSSSSDKCWKCGHCGSSYNQKEDLETHMREAHSSVHQFPSPLLLPPLHSLQMRTRKEIRHF